MVEHKRRAIVEQTTRGKRRWYRMLRVRLEVLQTPVIDVWNGTEVPLVTHSSESSTEVLTDEEFESLLRTVTK